MANSSILTSSTSLRLFNPPFTGNLARLEDAGKSFFERPVHVKIIVVSMDVNNANYSHIKDEITIVIINVSHRSSDRNIVSIQARVVDGSKNIKTVPVHSEGNTDAEEEILHNEENITIIADIANGDAAIIMCDNGTRMVQFNNLSSILPRLALPEVLPVSKGDPVEWDDFGSDQP